ncbi:Myosin heavy chain, skeletal muscle, adult [Coniochaeta hoffmannii]|uniref:Myosin heavy chain, skeletal muscle, adult n=1 Tax=Coniochaeta hoffmannii TaxID=91930 RepID=A0AA38RWF8_9PEZI|nr:Myosin heavy chain, skeletal muscle, adult [Coniochaeta hoffmannii]
MADNIDLPIALRRTRRSLGTDTTTDTAQHDTQKPPCRTPKPKPKKRVRFSDPGPLLSPSTTTSGLTPLIRRTTLLNTATTTHRRRRHSTPSHPRPSGSGLSSPSPSSSASSRFPETEGEQEVQVHITPLRQVLSGRVQRRIRRNGLSEEMNAIQSERRQRLRREREEVERLRAEVAARDAEIARLKGWSHDDETVVLDSDERVWELEREIEGLRRRLGGSGEVAGGSSSSSSSPVGMDWTLAARDPYAEGEYTCGDTMDLDVAGGDGDGDVGVEEFGESSLAELACSTPTRRGRGAMLATPPTTSPAAAASGRSSPPCGMATPRSHVGVQVEVPQEEKERMEEELASLQLELAKLTTSLEGYAAFAGRLKEKLGDITPGDVAGEETSSPHPEIEYRIETLLRTLSDRTTALLELTSTISSLGFPGSDADEILRNITTAFRTARLELEYLTPGEISLPLTSSGAAVLDLLLDRLRDLARKAKESDENIDEYHALELSLRQQLSARVDVTDALTKEVGELKRRIQERDGKIEEQSVGLDRLKGAVASYARDVGELEELVGKLEGEKTAAVEELEGRLAKQTKELEGKLAELEEKHAETLGRMRKNHKDELAGLNKNHGAALALRDARVSELRGEIERVNASLRAAHETVQKLRVENERTKGANERLVEENKGLAEGAEAERRRAKEVVDGMRSELERVVRMSEGLLATPRKKKAAGRRDSGLGNEDVEEEVALVETPTTASRRGSFLSGDLAKKGGRKRRRYDSGLGFLDEDEVGA